ncbi:histone H3.v1-like [Diaphorina citri]|uniref:Histone H3.v1-like n=1 Tax=Diaphorina citri TaxID=121845 RepID=A0A3Q0JC11_DIACI|nr:histone H3.v1-like [Diaphorina citri]
MSLTPCVEQEATTTCQALSPEQRIVEINILEERVEAVESILRNVSSELKNVNLDFQEAWDKINKLQEIMKLQQSIILLLLNLYAYNITGEYYIYPHLDDNNQRTVEDTNNNVLRIGEGVHEVAQYTDARLKELEDMNVSTARAGNSQKQENIMFLGSLPGDNMVQKSNGTYARTYDSNKCLFRSNTEPMKENSNAKERQYESEHKLEFEGNGSQEYAYEEQEHESHVTKAEERSKSPEYEEDLDEEEGIEEEEEKGASSGDTSGPDSPHEEEEYEEFNEERKEPKQDELKPEDIVPGIPSIPRFKFDSSKVNYESYENRKEPKQDELKPEDIVPGIPSIPRFKFDSSKVNYESYEKDLPKDKEDLGLAGGPLGSKWKLVKALKERKAEEKVAAETPTPVTTVSNALYFSF